MKIGFDAKRAFQNKTGLGNYSRTFIRALLEAGDSNRLYLFTPKIAEAGMEMAADPHYHIIQPHKTIHKFLPAYWRSHGLLTDIKEHGIEIFHGLSNELPVGIERLAVKKVVTIHDLIFLRFPELYPAIDRKIYERKFKAAIEKADLLIACSQQTASDIKTFYQVDSNKIHVVYQDCNSQFRARFAEGVHQEFKKKYQLHHPYVLSVGTIEKRKNQLNLLKAFHQADLKNTQLVFLGRKADLFPELASYIQSHSIENKVVFLDQVHEEELPLLYQNAMSFAYVSRFEGFGIPILEALRSGVTVMCSNESSLPEVAGNAALYAHADDVELMKKHLLELANDESLRTELQRKGLIQAELFNADKLAHQVLQLYQTLLHH